MTTNTKIEYEDGGKGDNNTTSHSTLNLGPVTVIDRDETTDVLFDHESLRIIKAENITVTGYRCITLHGVNSNIILRGENNLYPNIKSIEIRQV
jgi:hypothetical protein